MSAEDVWGFSNSGGEESGPEEITLKASQRNHLTLVKNRNTGALADKLKRKKRNKERDETFKAQKVWAQYIDCSVFSIIHC